MYYCWLRELCTYVPMDENWCFLWNRATKDQLDGTYAVMWDRKGNVTYEHSLVCRYWGETSTQR